MRLRVEVRATGPERPAVGSPIHVQIRDTTFEDAPAPVVAEATHLMQPGPGNQLAVVDLDLPELPQSAIVWVHADVDRDGRVSAGDFISTVSYPVSSADRALVVEVRKVL